MDKGYGGLMWQVVLLGVENSSSSRADNLKSNFLVLGEGPTYGINGNFDSSEEKCSINFRKAKTKFCLSLRYNPNNSYFLLIEKKF